MSGELALLTTTAASIGFFHTLLGPDHYLPFIALSKARGWSLPKTGWITFLCGVGHVGSSVLLGLIGIAVGIAVERLQWTESIRGEVAAWLLITFGLLYCAWGLRRAWQNAPHSHVHPGGGHHHDHSHDGTTDRNVTPWALFIIFVFGPCEPLIPILMYPAARDNLWSVLTVTAVFATATIGTMLGVVLLATSGLTFTPVKRLERFGHALAGAIIMACGVAIQLGL